MNTLRFSMLILMFFIFSELPLDNSYAVAQGESDEVTLDIPSTADLINADISLKDKKKWSRIRFISIGVLATLGLYAGDLNLSFFDVLNSRPFQNLDEFQNRDEFLTLLLAGGSALVPAIESAGFSYYYSVFQRFLGYPKFLYFLTKAIAHYPLKLVGLSTDQKWFQPFLLAAKETDSMSRAVFSEVVYMIPVFATLILAGFKEYEGIPSFLYDTLIASGEITIAQGFTEIAVSNMIVSKKKRMKSVSDAMKVQLLGTKIGVFVSVFVTVSVILKELGLSAFEYGVYGLSVVALGLYGSYVLKKIYKILRFNEKVVDDVASSPTEYFSNLFQKIISIPKIAAQKTKAGIVISAKTVKRKAGEVVNACFNSIQDKVF